jgi:HSP20 family protein
MAPARNPFRGVVDYISEMHRIADAMATMDTSPGTQTRGHSDAWAPTTDIFARGGDLVIRCELPGVASEDLEVAYSHGNLSITGARHRDTEDIVYYANERYYGAFRREISLPEGVREEDINADFAEGLLTITVGGAAEASGPRQITVQSKKK